MNGRLRWERDGRDWPNRASSRFVQARALRWHVQVMGEGPVALLLHGTGSSAHSFRALMPILAPRFTVVAPDLPGHGFTDAPASGPGYSLPSVARGVAALLSELGLQPVVAAGHSAGAAIALRMTLDDAIAPAAVVSLNGALLPFPGVTNDFLGQAARFLASSSVTATAFTMFAGSRTIERMMRSTGSSIDGEGMRLYARLAANAGHVHAALGLMANWDLRPLVRDLPRLVSHLVLVVGSRDGMVPPAEAYRVRSILPQAELVVLQGLGHLAHEEQPAKIAALMRRVAPGEEGRGEWDAREG